MIILCVETENEKGGQYIGLINEIRQEYQGTLTEFLQTKVFKFLDEKGEGPLMGSERKQSKSGSADMEFDKHILSSTPKSHRANFDEVTQLLDQIKQCNKQIEELNSQLSRTEAELEKEVYKSEELLQHGEAKDNEISRLADNISRLEESEKKLKAQLEDDTKVNDLEADIKELKNSHHQELETLHHQVEAKDQELEKTKAELQAVIALKDVNEKLDRENKQLAAERADLLKFKDGFERTEKEYIVFKNDYEIVKRSQETLQEEMKKTKERTISTENDNKLKDRALKDQADRLKDLEMKLNLKDSQIQDLEVRVARNTQIMTEQSQDFSVDLNNETSTADKSKQAEDQKRSQQFEQMLENMNVLKETIESEKSSHYEQIKKLTDRLEEYRREAAVLKKENEGLKIKVDELSSQNRESPKDKKKEQPVFPKDEGSLMAEMLQKSLELENNVRKFKLKSDELAQQLIRDREFYNTNLGIVYSMVYESYNSS